MAETIKQTEAIPAEYPDVTPFNRLGYIDEVQDAPVSADQIWQRIEAYIAHRYTPRAVVWIVEGAGDWTPPLTPATVTGAEVWEMGEWSELTLAEGPYGYCLAGDGPYRITATVGGGDVPAAVQEAFKRMHEYTRGINDSFKNETAFVGGEDGIPRGWTAKAMQLCGATDLLRALRRA
ncbi:MAG: hypothetical protein CMF72_15405 [Mameliella sp.]|nr:hypothetical protein [Mameliella sp.]|tara:strand:- start:664 stop:1197 length:534 start_codon:yes stop_codon:yes gene_type:complete